MLQRGNVSFMGPEVKYLRPNESPSSGLLRFRQACLCILLFCYTLTQRSTMAAT
jgi:hypothetical protein